MTVQQTRQLGIEFERRLHEIYPEFQNNEKLDTNTIYSFLSEFQARYIKDLYLAEDQIESGSRSSRKVNDVIKALIRHTQINTINESNSVFTYGSEKQPIKIDPNAIRINVPNDFGMYIRSTSVVDKNYKNPKKLSTLEYTPNKFIKQDDVEKVVSAFYNSKGILRNPLVLLEGYNGLEHTPESGDINNTYIKVIHDNYTNIVALDLTYCAMPHAFNVMNYTDDYTKRDAVYSYCELPITCFDELVRGAVDMYIQDYKFKLALNNNRRQQQQRRQRKEEDEQ